MQNPADSENTRKRPGAVLFMCGFNAIRSPMAEALAKRLLRPDIYIQSAGVRAGEHDPFVDAVMEEVGFSVERHRPRTIDQIEDDYFDLIVTLTPEAHHQALELTRTNSLDVMYWPTMDPTAITGSREQRLDAYRAVRDYLERLIVERLPDLLRPPQED